MMLALCHLLGLPARYVSGHLIGQGGTHAWVEVVIPRARDAIAVPFDPCHGRRGSSYVTVATGRDYSDVAPTSGSYVGTSGSRLTARRRVGVLAAAEHWPARPRSGCPGSVVPAVVHDRPAAVAQRLACAAQPDVVVDHPVVAGAAGSQDPVPVLPLIRLAGRSATAPMSCRARAR